MRLSCLGIAATTSALFLASASAQCENLSLSQILGRIGCGTEVGILQCLVEAAGSLMVGQVDDLRQCLRGLGCSQSGSLTGAEWIESDCGNEPGQDTIMGELKKRATTSTTSSKAGTTVKSTSAAATITTVSTTTQKSSSQASSDSSSSPSSSATSTSASITTGSTSTMATVAPTTTSVPLVCLSTSLSSISFCTTATVNGAASTSCTPTTTPVVGCAAGLLCQTNSDNTTTCMKKDDSLTLSGLIVTIVFGVILASLLGSLIFMCCSASKKSRAQKRARDSVFITGAVRARPEASEANLPLMNQQGPAGASRYEEYGTSRPDAHRMPTGSYSDITAASRSRGESPSLPGSSKLHPGLMVTAPQGNPFDEEDDVGYGGRR